MKQFIEAFNVPTKYRSGARSPLLVIVATAAMLVGATWHIAAARAVAVGLLITSKAMAVGAPGLAAADDPRDPAAGDCCVEHKYPGCSDPKCEKIVCWYDSFCCDVVWDAACADLANDLCEICDEPGSEIPPGTDCWYTLPDAGSQFSFADNPLPAGFFGPGSEPFAGDVPFGPCTGDDDICTEGEDILIERLGGLSFGQVFPSTDSCPAVLDRLELRSTSSFTVYYMDGSFEDWYVSVGLPGDKPSEGEMTVTKESPDGGTFGAVINANVEVTFTRESDKKVVKWEQSLVMYATNVPWQTNDPDGQSCDPNFAPGLGPSGCPKDPICWESDPPGLSICPVAPSCVPVDCPADVNGDGSINEFDALSVLGSWGLFLDSGGDVNGDGVVDGADLGIVLASYGPCEEALPPLSGSAQLFLENVTRAGATSVYELSVELDVGEALVNVYDANITSSLGFADVGLPGGSFVTIRSESPHPSVITDPNFDESTFSNGTHLGTDAGWFNFDPPNNLGLVNFPGDRILIGRFVVDPATEFGAELSITYEDLDGRPRQTTLALEEDPAIPGDLNGDGVVNVSDLLILFDNWGDCANCDDCPADLNDDCVVNVSDLLILFDNWG